MARFKYRKMLETEMFEEQSVPIVLSVFFVEDREFTICNTVEAGRQSASCYC